MAVRSDVTPKRIESLTFARTLACALGSLAALLLAAGCERHGSTKPGGSREVVVSTARLSASPPMASAPQPGDEARADRFLTSGSLAEPDGDRAGRAGAPTSGERSPTCVQGWSSPPRGSALRKAALDMMRSAPDERFLVDEIRYFVGPEDADVLDRAGEVERWYVKARTESLPERRQRWLVRRAGASSGIDAVAPYDSEGYGPRTWVRKDAVDPSFADPFQHPCDGEKERCMGLPPEVLGCLSGT